MKPGMSSQERLRTADLFVYEIEGIGADLSPRFPVTVLEENDGYVVETTAEGGGYRYHCDRSIPRGVSFRTYSFVMACVRRYGA